MSSYIHLMALTATATSSLRKEVETLLGMVNPVTIIRSPDKGNIRYASLQVKGSTDKLVVQELLNQRTQLPRIIVFCKCKTQCAELYK